MYEVYVLVGGALMFLAYKYGGITENSSAVHKIAPRKTPPAPPPRPAPAPPPHTDFAPQPAPQHAPPPPPYVPPPPPAPAPPPPPLAPPPRVVATPPPTAPTPSPPRTPPPAPHWPPTEQDGIPHIAPASHPVVPLTPHPSAPLWHPPSPQEVPHIHPAHISDPRDIFDPQVGQAVIQISSGDRDPQVAAHILSEVLGLPPIDAGQYAQAHKGKVIATHLKPNLAVALHARLRQDGIDSLIVRSADLEAVPFLGKAVLMEYGEDALHVTVDPDKSHRVKLDIPWNDIQMVCVGHVLVSHQETHHELEVTHMVSEEPHPLHRVQTHTSEDHLTAYIFTNAGYLHAEVRSLGYVPLAERMKPTGIQNFRTVMQDLLERARQARPNRGAAKLLAGEFPEIPSYRSPAVWHEEACGAWLAFNAGRSGGQS